MILGQLLVGKANATATYYSPWFPRGGNLAEFTCQVFASEDLSGSNSFEVSVQTKNSEQSDKDFSTPQGGGATAITVTTALGLTTWSVGANLSSANAGFLELVRFKYELKSVTANTEPWVHFRILSPVWLSN